MAINSAEKRRNITGLLTGVFSVGVTPNAAKDVEWRQQAGWGYLGIVPSGTPPVEEGKIRRGGFGFNWKFGK